ncbi:hypothetical protein ANN_00826 [Periplaneta americana]|uniref:Uncharacterized protein n=1 Tax=Periplaneta americana TaxID=6978 RepID=A0ABQ8TRX6_PERAM|nr:hypothetical protein ANN_00826 [Periplaneta americana]
MYVIENPHNDSSNVEYVDSTANVSSLNTSLFDQGVFLIKQERLQQQEKYKRQKFENIVKDKVFDIKMPRNQDLSDSEILSQLQENFQNSAFEYIIRKAKVRQREREFCVHQIRNLENPLLVAVAGCFRSLITNLNDVICVRNHTTAELRREVTD